MLFKKFIKIVKKKYYKKKKKNVKRRRGDIHIFKNQRGYLSLFHILNYKSVRRTHSLKKKISNLSCRHITSLGKELEEARIQVFSHSLRSHPFVLTTSRTAGPARRLQLQPFY